MNSFFPALSISPLPSLTLWTLSNVTPSLGFLDRNVLSGIEPWRWVETPVRGVTAASIISVWIINLASSSRAVLLPVSFSSVTSALFSTSLPFYRCDTRPKFPCLPVIRINDVVSINLIRISLPTWGTGQPSATMPVVSCFIEAGFRAVVLHPFHGQRTAEPMSLVVPRRLLGTTLSTIVGNRSVQGLSQSAGNQTVR